MSVKLLADNCCTTIFHAYGNGVTVHDNKDVKITLSRPAALQGWRNVEGLWVVSLADNNDISQSVDVAEEAMNMYDLPLTCEVIQFMHAALGFPTKATLLAMARNGNPVTFPGLTVENINRYFPESDETQKDHMHQQRQGATKVINKKAMAFNLSGMKHKDVYLHVYETTKRSMYSNQTGCFPVTSSCGNKYLMLTVKLDMRNPQNHAKHVTLLQLTRTYSNGGSQLEWYVQIGMCWTMKHQRNSSKQYMTTDAK